MRVFALSDIHVDYEANRRWVEDLSASDYQDDLLILAGDVTPSQRLFERSLNLFARRFAKVLFVPGNHDLWAEGSGRKTSLDKFYALSAIVKACDVAMDPYSTDRVSIVPLL